jgi:hypothetical protein
MDYLQMIYAQSSLTAITHALKISIAEVKEKRPDAVDYISGMETHLQAMNETFMTLQECEKEIRSLREVAYNYHRENFDLKAAIEKLKLKNENLMEGI